MDWGDYQPFDARVDRPLRDATREVATDHAERLFAARPQRRAALAALWAQNAGDASLDGDDAPARLGGWLRGALVAAGPDALTGADAVRFTGVVADAAIWLGDRIADRARAADPAATVRWALFTSHKKATGYQRPVLVGFRKVLADDYYVDVAHMVATWADLAARGRAARPDFLATIEQITLADA